MQSPNPREQSHYNVLAPGPVNLHPRVRETLALPMIHHRTPEFDKILARVLERLKSVFATRERCFALTATGSGGMECLFVNTLARADQVLVVDSGKFGERWAEMARVFGLTTHVLKIPWGEPVTVAAVEAALRENPGITAVACQACETSTGTMHPIREIGALLRERANTIFLVDGITALGAYPLPMDEYGIDGLVGGSQKAFMLPAGLALVSFSAKAWARVEKSDLPRFYFDIRREKAANEKGETYFSSNVTLIRALDTALDLILRPDMAEHFREIRRRAEFTRRHAPALGFTLYSRSPADSLTALAVPAGVDGQKLRTHLEEKYRITLMGGQDQAKGKIIRIGHMGHILPSQMLELMLALYDSLKELHPAGRLPDKGEFFVALQKDLTP